MTIIVIGVVSWLLADLYCWLFPIPEYDDGYYYDNSVCHNEIDAAGILNEMIERDRAMIRKAERK